MRNTWSLLLAAAAQAESASAAHAPAAFAQAEDGALRAVSPDDPACCLVWQPGIGWASTLGPETPDAALIDLYLPICSATTARPVTVGHLGQSLDGFIATHAGESRWVTGHENILHLHRLRALCQAVIVGAGTVAADDPQLTTRLVPGPHPVRVVLDPGRRLGATHKVFTDPSAETIYVCAASLVRPGEDRIGMASVVGLDGDGDRVDAAAVMRLVRERGWTRVFVEGGGVTVSMFLEANLLDRLHVAIAPLLIGNGRPAIRLTPPEALIDCHRPKYRVFRTGPDVLFDCELGARAEESRDEPDPPITRVI